MDKVTNEQKGQSGKLTNSATGGTSWKENTNHRGSHVEKINIAKMKETINLKKGNAS